MINKRFTLLFLFLGLTALSFACQISGMPPTVENNGSASVPILGAGGNASTPSAPQSTLIGGPSAGGVPVLGGGSVVPPAFQSVDTAAQPVRVVQVQKEFIFPDKFSQDGVLLVVENPNPDLAILNTKCQITGYDSSGSITETSSFCDIPLLFPGERRTIFRYIFNHGSTPAAKLEFQIIQQGTPAKTNLTSAILSVERIKYMDGKVTGIVNNSTDYLIAGSSGSSNPPQLTALLYDDQGQVIHIEKTAFGIEFIPPKGKAAFEFDNLGEFTPARVEVFLEVKANQINPATPIHSPLQVGKVFRFLDESKNKVQAFFYVTNPNADRSITLMEYQIAAYDAQGSVLWAYWSHAPLVFPGERTIVQSPDFLMPGERSIDHVDVQVRPIVEAFQLLDYHAVGLDKNPLSVENCQYQTSDGSINCLLKNAWKKPINSAHAVVLGFDSSGHVSHASSGTTEPVPANGQINITFRKMWSPANDDSAPVRLEAFANAESDIS
jgi:hypothetical protein